MSTDAALRVAFCADLVELGADSALERLRVAGLQVDLLPGGDGATIAAHARDADALMLGYGVVDEPVLAALPRLRFIALASMGSDNVDVEAARRRGVAVSNVLGAATEEVATHALALALDALRGISTYRSAVASGRWALDAAPMPRRLSELTLGVVGLGRIGLAFAERAKPLLGRIIGFDPMPRPEAVEGLLELRELQEVLATADVLSLHLPLLPQTERLIDARALAAMPRDAVLVNVSRGGLIDSAAVRAALDEGHLAAVALDVLDEEPPAPGHPLVGHPRAIITPHAGFLSERALRDYVELQVDNVLAWARTGSPLTPV